jgi:CheY-specific phosphatase CheX
VTELGLSQEKAVEMTMDVWHGFLGVDLQPIEPTELPDDVIAAGITLKGDWYGGIVLTYPKMLATQAARQVLDVDAPSLDDMRDVVGELVNMMTARMKYDLPAKTEMSLPIVVVGEHVELSIAGTSPLISQYFQIGNLPFHLLILRTEP